MKRPHIILTTLFLTFLLFTASSAQKRSDLTVVPFSPIPYRVGERLTYTVSYSNFPTAAHVVLEVAGRGNFFERNGLQLYAHVETTEVVNAALYSLNNDYTTYVDPATGIPYRSHRVIREGGTTLDTLSEYNEAVGTDAVPPRVVAGEVFGTYDFLSAIFRLRALPLGDGAQYRFNLRMEQDEYQAELKVTGRETIKTNIGSFKTIVTQIRIRDNSKANAFRPRIYFSDDERHVPVLVTARHPSGEIRIELAGSEFIESAGSATNTTDARPTPTPVSNPTTAGAGLQLPAGLPFQVGETLNFSVFLGNSATPVGSATFEIRPRSNYFGRDGLLFAARAQTSTLVQRVFSANDQINSYVDPTTLLPFRTELRLQEGSYRVNRTYTYDQDRGTTQTDTGQRIEIPVGTHDFISVLYALRSLNLAPPKRNAVSLLVNNRPRTLFITSLKRENIELGGQTIPAIQLSLTTDDTPPDRYQFRAWVSADQRRLPLRLTAMSPLGLVRADLSIVPTKR